MDNNKAQDSQTKYGKVMMFAAWGIGLLMLTVFFSDILEKQYNPNQSPRSMTSSQGAEVQLLRNRMGHYVSNGLINSQQVTFMLDTGATNVSIPAHLGPKLGLQAGPSYMAQTANGSVRVASTKIKQLNIGDITLYNVNASLNPGMRGEEILLGMSALKELEFTQRGDLLILRHY